MGGNPSSAREDDFEDVVIRDNQNNMPEEREFAPTPMMEGIDPSKKMMVENLEQVFDISEDVTGKGIEKDENYGIIPLNVIHNVMLFQRPHDLLSMCLTCRLFNNSQNTTFFWKSYYHHYFKIEEGSSTTTTSIVEEEVVNWKKQFYKRFYLYCEDFYLLKYHVVAKEEYDSKMKKMKYVYCEPGYDAGKTISFKVVILGDSACGKTTFLERLLRETYSDYTGATIGASFSTISLEYETKQKGEKSTIKLEMWDTAGAERYRSLAPMYYRGSDGIIVFFAVDSLESFERAKKWIEEIFRHGQLRKRSVVLAGGKCDLCGHFRKVDFKLHIEPYLKKEEKKNKNFNIYYVECSAKENINNFKVLGLVVDCIVGHPKDGRYYAEDCGHNLKL